MADKTTTLQELKDLAENFSKERDWDQFHSPKNISMDITIEAAELAEIFLWSGSKTSFERAKEKNQEVQDEVGDILHALLIFCNQTGIDLVEAFKQKLEKTKKKYPVDKCKGKSKKYTEY